MSRMSFHDEVRIIPYQEEWRKRFRQIKEVIIGILLAQDIECDVRHVSGTAVPGMCSKPIVDILVMVKAEDLLPAVRGLSEEFLCLGECGRVGRWFFSMGDNEHMMRNASCCTATSTTPANMPFWRNSEKSFRKPARNAAMRALSLSTWDV